MDGTGRTDVLIIGAGPSGLMAAAWMAQMGVNTIIIDQSSHRTRCGRADGLESRTLEILDSFGLADKVWAQANHTVEIALWSGTADGKLQRQSISANSKPSWSRFHESTLSQGQIEEYLMDYVKARKHVEVKRETMPASLDIDYETIDNHDAFPIRVNLENVLYGPKTPLDGIDTPYSEISEPQSDDSGYSAARTVEAKYILGCDGAHSWLRKQLGLRLEGESYDDSWGVLDMIPLTDFPDIRKRFLIKSQHGTLMMIPRERKLVRVYVELPPESADRYRVERNPEILMKQVATMMQPYTMSTSHIDWSTIYTVGQRICPKISVHNRAFLAGDAIHTHSPKAGQGMNVSIQDTFNLGWKLASVIKGVLHPRVLETYQQERLPVAERLIVLDQRICRGMRSLTGNPRVQAQHGNFDEDHKQALEEENTSLSGLGVVYRPNSLVSPTDWESALLQDVASSQSRPSVAPNLQIGARIPSVLIINQSDSQACHLQQILPSTGQWNLLVFGGDVAAPNQKRRVERLAEALDFADSVFLKMNNPINVARRGFPALGVYLVHRADRFSVELNDLPTVFRPWTEDGVDYSRVWADCEAYHYAGGGKLYSSFGIGEKGCMALLRPDQHLAFLSDLGDVEGLERFLQSVMPETTQQPVF